MKLRFDGQTVLITGAARGIGKNIALRFADAGANVAITDLPEHQAIVEDYISKYGENDRIKFFPCDLSLESSAENLVDMVVSWKNGLHVLINNARSGVRKSFLEETRASWSNTMSVSLDAAFFCSRACILAMQASGGAIINIGSVAGCLATAESPAYHAAKGALHQLTRYLAKEAGPYGVRVNCIAPGFIVKDEHTNRFEGADNKAYKECAEKAHPIGHTGRADDVADTCLFLSSSMAKFTSGQTLLLDGGMSVRDQSDLVMDLLL